MTSHRLPRALIGLLAATLLATATGCVRIETPPPAARTATESTVQRDALAESLDAVVRAISDEDSASVAAAVESQSIDALVAGVGPRYTAYPESSPSPSSSTESTTVADAAAAALATSMDVAETSTDEDLRGWAASAALVHGLAEWLQAAADGTVSTAAQNRGLPVEALETELTVPDSTALGSETLSELALRHDQARYLYELVASRLDGADRTAMLERAALHSARSDALQSLAGTADQRTELYSTSAGLASDSSARLAALRDAESAIGSAYAAAASSAGPEEVRWLLDGAFDAYAAGSVIEGWTVWDLPELAGFAPPEPAATD